LLTSFINGTQQAFTSQIYVYEIINRAQAICKRVQAAGCVD